MALRLARLAGLAGLAVLLPAAPARGEAEQLTAANFEEKALFGSNGGKNGFVKFQAPW